MPIQQEQLLRVRELTPEELFVWLGMYKMSLPNNKVPATPEKLRTYVNRLINGRRLKKKQVIQAQEGLIEKRVIPNKREVYPFSGESEQITEEGAQEIVDAAIANYKAGMPDLHDSKSKEHAQLGHFLVALDAIIFCQKIEIKTLQDADGNPIIVNERPKKYKKAVWDYAFAQKMLNKYGFDHISKTIYQIYEHGYFDNLKHRDTLKAKKDAVTRYVIAVLEGEQTPTSDGQDGLFIGREL